MSLLSTGTRRKRAMLTGALVAGSLIVAACGGSSTDDKASGVTKASTPAAGASVVIDTFMFSPQTLQVKVGDTVTWTNHDNILHTVTSGTREYQPGDSGRVTATNKDGTFDEQLETKNATATHTFAKAGTFHYFCDRHPGMEADVKVS